MRSAREVKPAGQWHGVAIDRVVLNADDRHRRRVVLTAERGTRFLLDLLHATVLHDGDGLVLDDGSIVCVSGGLETLAEIEGRGAVDVVRLAWHLGNRHAQVQILDNKLRIRPDHVLEAMAEGLGGRVRRVQAAFEPEIAALRHHGPHDPAAAGDRTGGEAPTPAARQGG